jgi:hypothetical protein
MRGSIGEASRSDMPAMLEGYGKCPYRNQGHEASVRATSKVRGGISEGMSAGPTVRRCAIASSSFCMIWILPNSRHVVQYVAVTH